MKSYTFACILLCLFLSDQLIAQTTKSNKIKYGFAYGITVNDVFNHEDGANFTPKITPILLSVFMQVNSTEKWGFIGEVDYIHKGPDDYVIDYLTISGLAQYRFLKKNTNISALLGVYGGYLFQYKISGMVHEPPQLKNYDIGIETGLDYTHKVNDNIDIYISPRVEIGAIRFSYTNHISYQLKVGLRF